jgi:NADH-quinone oxidoreductase subunit J
MTPMDLSSFLFWVVALLTGGCAVTVVVTQNIVRAATWLLFTLAGTSVLFFLLGADFVGATQLLVYVGGTMVLLVFGVMLTAQQRFLLLKASRLEWATSGAVGALLFGILIGAIVTRGHADSATIADSATSMNSMVLGEALIGIKEATPKNGVRARVGYLLPFEVVSVHLLVVLIGAAYLARAKRRREVRS